MLVPLWNVSEVVEQKGAASIEWRVLGHWLSSPGLPDSAARWLADDPAYPGVVLRLEGSSCMLLGEREPAASALHWLAQYGERRESGELYLDRVNATVRAVALSAGFMDDPSIRQPYYSAQAWYIDGGSRFAEQVRYPCRTAEGLELVEHFLTIAESEHDQDYLRCCLGSGPSFVCALEGEPVCWSLTHLGGAMGRIYTPPQVRGRGYARSLTAFQVDDTLRRRGIAVASVSVNNPASYRMLEALGAEHLTQPLTWSRMRWPVR